jgi:hypothetical protein
MHQLKNYVTIKSNFQFFLSYKKVELTQEHITYQWENFVADFGGYLGLLLGASLLDIYDLMFKGIKNIWKYLKNKY